MNSSASRYQAINDSPVFHTGCTRMIKFETPKSTCKKCGKNLPKPFHSEDNERNAKYCKECANRNIFNNCKEYGNQRNINSSNSSCSSANSLFISSEVSSPETTIQPPNLVMRRSLLPHPVHTAKHQKSYNSPEQSTPSKLEKSFDEPSPHSSRVKLGSKRKSDSQEDFVKRVRASSPVISCTVSSSNHDDKLSKSIWQLYNESKQTQETYTMKMALRNQLHNLLLSRFPNCGLYVVGSSMTGLGSNNSDMDMCLMLTDSVIDQRKEAVQILHSVRFLFRKCRFVRDCQVIYAKVPILRFRDSVSGVEVDLNINNAIGIRNTQLLSDYSRIDKRLAPLVVLTKIWARSHGINDAKNNTLSSYSLVLMVIHYLQYACKPPVLPCLQKLLPDKYQPDSNVRKLKLDEGLPHFVSENKEDLGNLFRGFLEYFAKQYDYCKSVMSVRLGCLLSREESESNVSSSPNDKNWKFICIEEPFDLTNTARSVFKAHEFYYIRQVFQNSLNTLKNYGEIKYLL